MTLTVLNCIDQTNYASANQFLAVLWAMGSLPVCLMGSLPDLFTFLILFWFLALLLASTGGCVSMSFHIATPSPTVSHRYSSSYSFSHRYSSYCPTVSHRYSSSYSFSHRYSSYCPTVSHRYSSSYSFSHRYSSYSFSLILRKLGTHYHVIIRKNCTTDFRNFDFKIFGDFWKFLDFSAAAAAELSGPRGLTSFVLFCS